jgi:hypothetical protein
VLTYIQFNHAPRGIILVLAIMPGCILQGKEFISANVPDCMCGSRYSIGEHSYTFLLLFMGKVKELRHSSNQHIRRQSQKNESNILNSTYVSFKKNNNSRMLILSDS